MPAPLLNTSTKDLRDAFTFNVTTAHALTAAAVPLMLEHSGGGSIINITSTMARLSARGFAAYGTAKAALAQYTRLAALDLAPRIRVNAIAPGSILTSALEIVASNDALRDPMEKATPLRRLGDPLDIAAAAVYLASQAGSFLTGKTLEVDGGLTYRTSISPSPICEDSGMPIRVAQVGTGNVGGHALTELITNPAFELTGVWVSSEAKAGKDAAELAGLDTPTGIKATNDLDAVLATKPECAVYTAMADNRLMEALEDYRRILAAGVNVVGSGPVFLQYPWQVIPDELISPLQAAAEAGQASLYVNGIDPGFANDLLPLALAAPARASSRSAAWRSSTTTPTTARP